MKLENAVKSISYVGLTTRARDHGDAVWNSQLPIGDPEDMYHQQAARALFAMATRSFWAHRVQ